MKIGLITNLIFLLLLIGCKVHTTIIDRESKIFNNAEFNSKYSEIVFFNLKNEPNLFDTIKSFKRKNTNEKLEDFVILEFLELQQCTDKEGTKFQDYSNELQSIFDFYLSMNKEEFKWINEQEVKILRLISVRFIANYAKNGTAIEHLKYELNYCKNDKNHAMFVMSSYNSYECFEPKR